ncbi:MAG: hypothetical protein ACJAYN_003047 [Bermanella sp.]|jgi:hypothetical protein
MDVLERLSSGKLGRKDWEGSSGEELAFVDA